MHTYNKYVHWQITHFIEKKDKQRYFFSFVKLILSILIYRDKLVLNRALHIKFINAHKFKNYANDFDNFLLGSFKSHLKLTNVFFKPIIKSDKFIINYNVRYNSRFFIIQIIVSLRQTSINRTESFSLPSSENFFARSFRGSGLKHLLTHARTHAYETLVRGGPRNVTSWQLAVPQDGVVRAHLEK